MQSGVKVLEPAADLGIRVALASSFMGKPVGADYLVASSNWLNLRTAGGYANRTADTEPIGLASIVL